jgi:hypothetical protein
VEDGARDVTEADVATVVAEADAIEERFRDHGPLRRRLDDAAVVSACLVLLEQDLADCRQWRIQAAPPLREGEDEAAEELPSG